MGTLYCYHNMESKQNNKLGIKIKELRIKTGLSQDELARKADVAYTTLTKIAKALKVDIENLLK